MDKRRPNDINLHTVSHALCMNVCTIKSCLRSYTEVSGPATNSNPFEFPRTSFSSVDYCTENEMGIGRQGQSSSVLWEWSFHFARAVKSAN